MCGMKIKLNTSLVENWLLKMIIEEKKKYVELMQK